MAETSLQMATMESDENLNQTHNQISSQMEARPAAETRAIDSDGDSISTQAQMEARPAAETRAIDSDGDSVSTQAQMEAQQENLVEDEAPGETLESQINTQLKRRRFLRKVQKDMVSSMNAYAVVLVLLASVTFIGFMQPPGGVDDDGHLERRDSNMRRFIIYIAVSFYFAVAGILICMSCIAFLLPRATTYAGRSLVRKRKSKYSSVGPGLNSDLQNILEFEKKTNDKISRILKAAYLYEITANLLFVVSLLLTAEAFAMCAVIVIRKELINVLTSKLYWTIMTITFEGLFLLYILILLWNIIKAVKDLIVDLVKTVKRLSFKSVVRFGTSRTLL